MESASRTEKTSAILYYDGECPICSHFAAYARLRKTLEFELTNAREHPDKLREFKKQGVDINSGMILDMEGTLYHGEKAMVVLETFINSRGPLDNVLKFLYSSPAFMRFAYPVLKALRIFLMRMMGRDHFIKL